MLRYGCTRLEIGVQSVYEDVARDTNRGHTVRATCESFQMSKDAGFKVISHMMVSLYSTASSDTDLPPQPDLPNVGVERDIEQFHVSDKPGKKSNAHFCRRNTLRIQLSALMVSRSTLP